MNAFEFAVNISFQLQRFFSKIYNPDTGNNEFHFFEFYLDLEQCPFPTKLTTPDGTPLSRDVHNKKQYTLNYPALLPASGNYLDLISLFRDDMITILKYGHKHERDFENILLDFNPIMEDMEDSIITDKLYDPNTFIEHHPGSVLYYYVFRYLFEILDDLFDIKLYVKNNFKDYIDLNSYVK